MAMSIKKATLADLKQLSKLFDGYRVFYGQPSDVDGAEAFLRDRLSRDDSTVLLAVDGDTKTVVGFAQLYPSFSSVAMRPIWVLNDLFVAPSHRRTGVGKRLMDAVGQFAAQAGAIRVDLATARDNQTAKALYEACGYRLDQVFDHYKLKIV